MVQVSIRIRSGAASVSVRVVAASVERAMSIAGRRFPGGDLRVISSLEVSDGPKTITIPSLEAA